MKKTLVYVLSAVLLASTIIAAQAGIAQLGDAHGKVLVNHGKGFVAVTGAADLNIGDRIMIGDQSFATVSFAGCTVSLSEPTVFTVTKNAPCAAGQQAAVVEGAIVSPTADLYVPPIFPIWPILAGVTVVGVACAIGCGGLFNDNGDPDTPEIIIR